MACNVNGKHCIEGAGGAVGIPSLQGDAVAAQGPVPMRGIRPLPALRQRRWPERVHAALQLMERDLTPAERAEAYRRLGVERDERVKLVLASVLVPETEAEVEALLALAGTPAWGAARGSLAEALARGRAAAGCRIDLLRGQGRRDMPSAQLVEQIRNCLEGGTSVGVSTARQGVAHLVSAPDGSGSADYICCPRCAGEDIRVAGFTGPDGKWHWADLAETHFSQDGFLVVADDTDFDDERDMSTEDELGACQECGFTGGLDTFAFDEPPVDFRGNDGVYQLPARRRLVREHLRCLRDALDNMTSRDFGAGGHAFIWKGLDAALVSARRDGAHPDVVQALASAQAVLAEMSAEQFSLGADAPAREALAHAVELAEHP